MGRFLAGSLVLLSALAAPSLPVLGQKGAKGGQWRHYGGDLGSTKYSRLAQIKRNNVDKLRIRWRWASPDEDISGVQNEAFEATPLMIGGVLYTSTSFSQVAAIDAGTGQTRWVYDPESYLSGRPPNNGFLHRGVAFWSDGVNRRVLIATGDARLISLRALNGTPDPEFGDNGIVDLKTDIPRRSGTSIEYGMTSPPIVVGDVVIVGSSIHDGDYGPEGIPGDVRGYDVRTGERLWTFHTVPREGEFGVETWEDDSWRYSGGANVWAPMSADAELGYVYLPVSCPTNNYNGGKRPGDNLFANSLVALDAITGERIWHFQTIHHDIWDYDLGSPPNLVDIKVDGELIEAVAQVTKQGFTFVFDRATGVPVWPINEVPVPKSNVMGEKLSLTQPFPTKPPAFSRQGVTIDDLIDFTPPMRAQAVAIIDQYRWGSLFTAPTPRGTILNPGIGGGANWGGASFDPVSRTLFVTDLGSVPFLIRLGPGGQPDFKVPREVRVLTGPGGQFHIFKPPWGEITAINLNRGKIRWRVPNDGVNGVAGMTKSLATATLLFVANRSELVLRAFDKRNGTLLAAIGLPARPTGAPMTYRHQGRQYVVVAVGSGAERNELIALSLP